MAGRSSGGWATAVGVTLLVLLFTRGYAGEAEHESGCMTCHQYPGLAVIEPNGKKRYLHIDEEARGNSPHATVHCVQCHTKIDRTPHTGIDTIECTTACHAQDRARIDAIDLSRAGIHDSEQTAIATIDHRSACIACHGIYPHTKDRHIRAIFNLHSAHLFCEVCHLDPNRPGELSYGWSDGDVVTFIGKPYGKVLGKTAEGYLLARIGVFEDADGHKALVEHSEDLAAVGAYALAGEDMSEAEQQEQLDYFHRGIVRKKITVACAECHKHDGRLDFRALGYDEHRAEELETLNMTGWATKYDTFYFPKLF